MATGSHVSHRGDPIEAEIIAPVSLHGNILIPQGTRVHGAVENVIKLGFGLKHRTASIEYRFSALELVHGETLPIEAQLVKVETAKERVGAYSVVFGVHPLANLSSASAFFTLSLLFVNPVVGAPLEAVKALIAPSTSPEIYFPPGTELVLRLNSALDVSRLPREPIPVTPFPEGDVAAVQGLLTDPLYVRARSGSRPSDLVNLLFMGTRRQIENAFQSAGWYAAERKSPVALYRMYNAITRRIGYRKAPMDALRLNGKYSDFVYQKSLNNVAERHHVRFWKETPEGDLWLGAATEDVAMRFRQMHWTHLSDPAIDQERAKVVNDLAFTGCIASASLLARAAAPAVNANRSVVTDGNIAAVRFDRCEHPKFMPGVDAQLTAHRTRWFPRVMGSFRDDLLRSNPFFTAFNTLRCLTGKRSARTQAQGLNAGSVRPGLDWLKTHQHPPVQNAETASLQ